jgi:hypothetical protein
MCQFSLSFTNLTSRHFSCPHQRQEGCILGRRQEQLQHPSSLTNITTMVLSRISVSSLPSCHTKANVPRRHERINTCFDVTFTGRLYDGWMDGRDMLLSPQHSVYVNLKVISIEIETRVLSNCPS